jgi:Fe2+ or Zn2+ uptake regulation protein
LYHLQKGKTGHGRSCRESGLRFTVQRRLGLESVLDLEDHQTADRVYAAVEALLPGVSSA